MQVNCKTHSTRCNSYDAVSTTFSDRPSWKWAQDKIQKKNIGAVGDGPPGSRGAEAKGGGLGYQGKKGVAEGFGRFILMVTLTAHNFPDAFNSPLYIVSKSVCCTRYSVNKSLIHST